MNLDQNVYKQQTYIAKNELKKEDVKKGRLPGKNQDSYNLHVTKHTK